VDKRERNNIIEEYCLPAPHVKGRYCGQDRKEHSVIAEARPEYGQSVTSITDSVG
jgi:hypothetical protein